MFDTNSQKILNMSKEILDDIQFTPSIPLKRHRPLAIILEVIPLILFTIALFTGAWRGIILSFVTLAAIYLFGGWYIFKADKYRTQDIIFVELVVIFSVIPLLSALLYKILSWPGANEMLYAASYLFIFLFIVICFWYYKYKNRPLEWRLSIKLLIRVFILLAFNLFVGVFL